MSEHLHVGPSEQTKEEVVSAMARAGQELAIKWGHPAWSDSWARLVAETLNLAADLAAAGSWRCTDCECVNALHEAFCFRCGAGQPEEDDRVA